MWSSINHFYPCLSCNFIMIGIFKPIAENQGNKNVAREICYECVEAEKLRAEVG